MVMDYDGNLIGNSIPPTPATGVWTLRSISGVLTWVYVAATSPTIPVPVTPTSGTWTLRAVNGTVGWIQLS